MDLDQIIGQARAIDVLMAAMTGERMHHAWILHGPVGVGKATTARAMAKLLMCHDATPDLTGRPTACGACASCKMFIDRPAKDDDDEDTPREFGESHPDLHVIRKELAAVSDIASLRNKKQMNIPIDLLRERMVGGWIGSGDGKRYVEPAIGRKPNMKHGKVFIIDEAELLDATGQNALLKTLEEPPAETFIFLITSHEDRLLTTIRSRCQRVGFGPLSDADVERWLDGREEASTLNAEQRKWVIKFACGSLGRALLAMTYHFDEWYTQVVPMVRDAVQGKPAPALGETMAKLVEAFAKAWVDGHKGASKDAANKAGVRYMLGLLGELCRDGLRHAAGRLGDEAPGDEADAKLRPWLVGVQLLQEAERQMESNVALALLLDNLAIQWSDKNALQHAAR